MAIGLTKIRPRTSGTIFTVMMFLIAATLLIAAPGQVVAQDADDKKKDAAATPDTEKGDTDKDTKAEADEPDPFAVPTDATVEELFDFIQSVKRKRGKTIESVTKSAKAAVAGAQAIRDLDEVDVEDEIKAIREQLSALAFLSQFDRPSKKQLAAVVESLQNDERPEISKLAAIEAFKIRINSARGASKEEQTQMVADLKAMVADGGLDRTTYGLASSLARAIGYSENAELAASLYEDLSVMMNESDDESIKGRAEKMVGAARRMRLPGNFMEVMGTTSDGKEFDWDAYRGKVVLVDFWASWCGPCRGEVPNMKRNLERYGEQGFEIVGVNLDRTLDACEKYVEQEELTWPNLMSDKDGERGWDNPLASHYGISAIPTAILVDQEGKVVSLRARGKELDRLLEEMLGAEADEDAPEAEPAEKA